MVRIISHNLERYYLSDDNVLSAYGYVLEIDANSIAKKLGFDKVVRIKDFSFKLLKSEDK